MNYNDTKFLTIVIPVFNGDKYLSNLARLEIYNNRFLEVIIVDDSSAPAFFLN